MPRKLYDKVERTTDGGITRYVVSVSFNAKEFAELKKMQTKSDLAVFRNNTSLFIKHKVFD